MCHQIIFLFQCVHQPATSRKIGIFHTAVKSLYNADAHRFQMLQNQRFNGSKRIKEQMLIKFNAI